MIIRWLPRAIHNRDAQLDYIAERNESAAINQDDRIEYQVNQLLDYPKTGRPGRVDGTHELERRLGCLSQHINCGYATMLGQASQAYMILATIS